MTSSPECWVAFGVLLAAQYNDPRECDFISDVVREWLVDSGLFPRR